MCLQTLAVGENSCRIRCPRKNKLTKQKYTNCHFVWVLIYAVLRKLSTKYRVICTDSDRLQIKDVANKNFHGGFSYITFSTAIAANGRTHIGLYTLIWRMKLRPYNLYHCYSFKIGQSDFTFIIPHKSHISQ